MEQDFGATTQVLTLELAEEPKVLLVDDDLVLARLAGLVAEAGFEVCTADMPPPPSPPWKRLSRPSSSWIATCPAWMGSPPAAR